MNALAHLWSCGSVMEQGDQGAQEVEVVLGAPGERGEGGGGVQQQQDHGGSEGGEQSNAINSARLINRARL